MTKIILYFLVNILALLIVSNLLPSFEVISIYSAAVFVFILTLLNYSVVAIIKFLAFPLNFLTLGLFNTIISLIAISFTASIIKGINISGTFLTTSLTVIIIAFALSLAQTLVGSFSND